MQALRASSTYSLALLLNNSLLMTPDMAQALTEELEEDDDA